MSIKSVLILLTMFIGANADLIHFIAEGEITSRSIQQLPPTAGSLPGSALSSDYLPAIPAIGDLLTTEVLIDTDNHGSVMVNNNIIDPATPLDPSAGNFQTTSYLPLLISSSGFPSVHELYLQNDNSTTIRNVREFTNSNQIASDQSPSDLTLIEYTIGSILTDQSGFSLPYSYFSTVLIASDLSSVVDGDTAIILEGFVHSRVIDETPVITVTYLKSKYATLHSFSRITQVPEPSAGALLISAAFLFSVIFLSKTGLRSKKTTHYR